MVCAWFNCAHISYIIIPFPDLWRKLQAFLTLLLKRLDSCYRNMSCLTLPNFEVIRHATKKGQKRISVHFTDPDIVPGEALLDVLNAKRGGLASYSRIRSTSYGWVFPQEVWQNAAQKLGLFDMWAPLRNAFEDAMEEWYFEVQAI